MGSGVAMKYEVGAQAQSRERRSEARRREEEIWGKVRRRRLGTDVHWQR
jgi:hypothetical protein